MSGSSDDAIDQMEALREQNALLRAALEDIRTTAHCIAKAGPLHTHTMADAWARFMGISDMASSALAKHRKLSRL